MGAGGAGAVAKVGGGLLSAYSTYSDAKETSKQIKEEAEFDIAELMEEGRLVREQQNLISSGGGYVLNAETSPFRVMLDTEKRYKKQANTIFENARNQARSVRRRGNLKIAGDLIGTASSAGSQFGGDNAKITKRKN